MSYKYLICFALSLISLAYFIPKNNNEFLDLAFKYNAEISYYYPREITNIPNSCTFIKNGTGGILVTNAENLNSIIDNLTDYDGISITFRGTQIDCNNIIKSLKIKINEQDKFDNITCIYGTTHYFKKFIKINNKKTNIQIAFNNNRITIGTPIILGSY